MCYYFPGFVACLYNSCLLLTVKIQNSVMFRTKFISSQHYFRNSVFYCTETLLTPVEYVYKK